MRKWKSLGYRGTKHGSAFCMQATANQQRAWSIVAGLSTLALTDYLHAASRRRCWPASASQRPPDQSSAEQEQQQRAGGRAIAAGVGSPGVSSTTRRASSASTRPSTTYTVYTLHSPLSPLTNCRTQLQRCGERPPPAPSPPKPNSPGPVEKPLPLCLLWQSQRQPSRSTHAASTLDTQFSRRDSSEAAALRPPWTTTLTSPLRAVCSTSATVRNQHTNLTIRATTRIRPSSSTTILPLPPGRPHTCRSTP